MLCFRPHTAGWDRMTLRLAAVLVLATTAALAQTPSAPSDSAGAAVLDGTWEGHLSNGGMGLPLVFVVTTAPGKGTTAVLDILDPDAGDIPVAAVTRAAQGVRFDVPAVGGRFDGQLSDDLATLSGRWTQAGAAGAPVPLILTRALARPAR